MTEQVRAHSAWVENHCGTMIGDALARLNETYNTNCGQVQLSALVGIMAGWTTGRAASDGDSDSIAVAPRSIFKVLTDKLDECEGLTIAEQDARSTFGPFGLGSCNVRMGLRCARQVRCGFAC